MTKFNNTLIQDMPDELADEASRMIHKLTCELLLESEKVGLHPFNVFTQSIHFLTLMAFDHCKNPMSVRSQMRNAMEVAFLVHQEGCDSNK